MSVFRFIGAWKVVFDVSAMCRVLRVSRSGFYAWDKRPESDHARQDSRLSTKIRAIFKRSRGRYGAPRVHKALQADGEQIGRKRVARLMRQQGLRARQKRRFVVTTQNEIPTASLHLLAQQGILTRSPNKVRAGDITYLPTRGGWLYLAVLIDLFSRRLVG